MLKCGQVRIRSKRIVVGNQAPTCFEPSSRVFYIEVPLVHGKVIRDSEPVLMDIKVSTKVCRYEQHFYCHADGKQGR